MAKLEALGIANLEEFEYVREEALAGAGSSSRGHVAMSASTHIMSESRIEILEQQLSELERQKEKLLIEREVLLNSKADSITTAQYSKTLSADQKVKLFMSLFKGRADVFANRWKNTQGRSGYSVACDNEWVPNICHKPKVKCMDCTNQRFIPRNEQVIYQHLAGKRIVGLYPLLQDNNCHLFAVDFDKSDWKEVVIAAAKSCCLEETVN